MALSFWMQRESYNSLISKYAKKLSETDKKLLELVNNAAAQNNIPLHLQSQEVTNYLIELIKKSETRNNEDLPGTALFIYDLITELMESQSTITRRKHLAQGHFDLTPLHRRDLHDQMQDHDMTRSMPRSVGNISVLAVLNRLDSRATDVIQEALTHELLNEGKKHIIIPVGPKHWRGVYITRNAEKSSGTMYDVELFDPYGPGGARAIDSYVLNLLANCGIARELIKLRHAGPPHPQGDAYSCGDFTNAYSHKKMKEFGAPKGHYNENLVNTLNNLGNVDDALRFMTREETAILTEKTNRQYTNTFNGISPFRSTQQEDNTPPTVNAEADAEKNKQQSFSWMRIGIEIGGVVLTSALGALIGGLIAAFTLSGLGLAIAVGAITGTSLGASIVGLTRLFSPPSSSSDNTGHTSTKPEQSKSTPSNSKPTQDVEPIITPPLFSNTPPQATNSAPKSQSDSNKTLGHNGP